MTTPSHPAAAECQEAVRRLWDYLDAEVDPAQHAGITAHLQRCADCAAHFAFARQMLAVVRHRWPQVAVPQDLTARIRARLAEEGPRVA